MILTSWDDGAKDDLMVLSLLRKYKLPAIFFVPIESWGFLNLNVYNGFKVGGHTYRHPQDLKLLSPEELEVEIGLATKVMAKKVGYRPEWFCYPRGRYNEAVVERVKAAGYKYARTTKIGVSGKQFEKNGFHCYERSEYDWRSWEDYIINAINEAKPTDEVHIWGHSWEIAKHDEWRKLERVLAYAADHNQQS